MSLGPVMLDVEGLQLSAADRKRLLHPQTGGVILFARNYQSPAQLKALVDEIHAIRRPRLIVAVDQEGGRVQRFKTGFQRLPAMGLLGDLYERSPLQAMTMAETVGWVAASELLFYGVDLSFSPVLDLGHKISSVIGDRAFHTSPDIIVHLANALIRGMNYAGMEAVGKHFPGHGSVEGDSHHVMPFDKRALITIESHDLIPFRQVINTHLTGIMMAHVIYEQVDKLPAGFSSYWIKQVLRDQLNFDGIVFSDDLSMSGAEFAGSYAERARLSLKAGCDMLLVCNNPEGADEVLDYLQGYNNPVSQLRLVRLHGRPGKQIKKLFDTQLWKDSIVSLHDFMHDSALTATDDLFSA
ncbi:MAG: beta-N-acetylhexosaminidase [Gammaproteobacteria bacterium]|nr:beta-N-acetylhexosaminidase [Gammaproteobacteria bacterium]MBL7000679.1 beta-N-acetylhexosaminidase [Gammaproteobacteria bacterium]